MTKRKVVITIKDGVLEEVLTSHKDIRITVCEYNTGDEKELKELKEVYTKETKGLKYEATF